MADYAKANSFAEKYGDVTDDFAVRVSRFFKKVWASTARVTQLFLLSMPGIPSEYTILNESSPQNECQQTLLIFQGAAHVALGVPLFEDGALVELLSTAGDCHAEL